MAWKPKEKEVTPEEAIAQAKKELAPYWHGSTPLVCGVEAGETVHAQPLDPAIIKGTWMLFFGDPTGFSGHQAMHFLEEFLARYDHLGIRFIWVFRPLYQFQSLPRAIDQLVKKLGPEIPIVRDTRGLLGAAFGAQALPKLVVIHDGKLVMNPEGPGWMKDTEQQLQTFLRSNDPGVAATSGF